MDRVKTKHGMYAKYNRGVDSKPQASWVSLPHRLKKVEREAPFRREEIQVFCREAKDLRRRKDNLKIKEGAWEDDSVGKSAHFASLKTQV